jgi:peptidyl-prolyl cis-trans isomerase SurA
MKKLLLVLGFCSLISGVYCQTLFTYGKHAVSAPEFLKAYHKNAVSGKESDEALRDYLDLYIKFKLKVQAAKDLHLDTVSSMQTDLKSFRSQVEENYLTDENETSRLVEQAFARSQKDIHAIHFFIPADNVQQGDSTKNKMLRNDLYLQLNADKKTSSEVLAEINKKGITVQEQDLGFITVFNLPYEYENLIYGLQPSKSSVPYRTSKGWHIFKNVSERPAVGKVTLAQILLAVPGNLPQQREQTKKLADSVYSLLQDGADFAHVAKDFSEDRMTYMNGGVMPEFGTSKYTGEFEKQAFSLAQDGQISQPFETQFGWHILKRISARPVPETMNDEAFMTALKQEVINDSRINVAKQKFIADILPKTGLVKHVVNKENLWKVTDTSLLANKNITSGKVNEKTVLFSFNDNKQVTVSDWIQFLRNSAKTQVPDLHKIYISAYEEFTSASATKNYRNRLENFNPAFKSQLEEFKEGNMLFEVMEMKIWGKASSDSVGLLKYYKEHKQKYKWEASAEAIVFSCANKNIAKHCIEELNAGKSWSEVVNNNSIQVQADSGRYELGQIPVIDRTNFTVGLITAPVVNKNDGTTVFSKILKLYPNGEQRTFKEARGLVINDYQNFLEAKWIEQLKKQYPVKVDEKVFQTLSK